MLHSIKRRICYRALCIVQMSAWSQVEEHQLAHPVLSVTSCLHHRQDCLNILSLTYQTTSREASNSVNAFWEESITTNALAYPSLVIIALYKLTDIWLAFNHAFNFFHPFIYSTNIYILLIRGQYCFRCWVIATEKKSSHSSYIPMKETDNK